MSTSCDSAFETALQYIPGGVNSPVRAFGYVGGTPLFIAKAKGAYLEDIEGRSYVDYIGSWGPMILGHNHPAVIKAVHEAVDKGLSFGAPTELETLLAQQICALIPSIEQIRMVNSGTEATMSAIRLARGYTKRNKIIKFIGCYHGHSDGLLVQAGSGALTFGHPSSPGVPASVVEHTLLAPYNDLAAVENLFSHYGDDIAAIIVEPIAGNMNCVLPNTGFLAGLRKLCDRYQSVLIFDEVMTGFRVHPQGAQGLYGIKPDLSTFGKIIGGGMPVGAFGGRCRSGGGGGGRRHCRCCFRGLALGRGCGLRMCDRSHSGDCGGDDHQAGFAHGVSRSLLTGKYPAAPKTPPAGCG